MKKTICRFFLIMMALFVVAAAVACEPKEDVTDDEKTYVVSFDSNGGSAVSDQEVKSGKLATEPKDPTKDEYEFTGWYSDSKLTTLYDFSTPVKADLKLYAGWSEIEKNIILVQSVSLSSNLVTYNSNKGEKDNKRTEFFTLNKTYQVGDDNAWSAKPAVSFLSYNTKTKELKPITVTSWSYTLKVEVYNEDATAYVAANESLIDAIDLTNATVDFAESAIGSKFRVSVTPDGLTETQLASVSEYTVSFELEVIDGYNVYSAKDLALLENRPAESYPVEVAAWSEFKKANGIDETLSPKALIIHQNINITVDDIPELFVYAEKDLNKSDSDYERTLGSLKDIYFIYVHSMDSDGVKIVGNYFALSASTLPVVTRENGDITPEGEVISHATLFYFEDDKATGGEAVMEDLNLIGNAPKVEDNIKAGGIIMVKATASKFTARNNVAVCWFITYMPNRTNQPVRVDYCKCYDNFNSFLYNWGSPDFIVSNSEMIGAGGPVVIQDHVDSTAADGGLVPSTKFVNSNVASYVVGTEGWFTVVKATALVPQIKQLNAYFTPFGRSFLWDNSDKSLTYMNLVCVNKSGSAQSITAEKVSGLLSIDDVVFDYGKSANPYLAGLLEQTFTLGAPAFQSSDAVLNDGIAYGTTTGLFDITNNQIMDPTLKLFSGSHLGTYYNGMMFILGYGVAGQVYTA